MDALNKHGEKGNVGWAKDEDGSKEVKRIHAYRRYLVSKEIHVYLA